MNILEMRWLIAKLKMKLKTKLKRLNVATFSKASFYYICFRVYYVYILAMKERNRIKKRKFNHPFTINFYHITMQLIYTNTILKKC